jgi:H+/Cl- antiporter ClcA
MAIRTAHPTHHVDTYNDTAYEDDRDLVAASHTANVAARIVWLIAGIIITLLAFRFVLALFGANPNNAFASFIYSTSQPFVTPFFNLFNYNYVDNGVGRIEIFTLIAIAVYGAIAGLIARLVSINRP